MTDEDIVTRQRVSFDLQPATKTLVVASGDVQLVLKTADDFAGQAPELREQLVLEGLRAYLQRVTLRVAEEDKLAALETAYNDLLAAGMTAFEKKGPRGQTGPKKAEKLAALAALKGTTVEAIKAALEGKPTDKVNALLNSPKVLAAVEKMKAKGEQLDLEL